MSIQRRKISRIDNQILDVSSTMMSQDLMVNVIRNNGYSIEILIDDVAFDHEVYAWRIIDRNKKAWTGSWLYHKPPYFETEDEAVESAIDFCMNKIKIKIL